MPPLQIMVIRHAEKPVTDPPTSGVDISGNTDSHSLIVVGWQRAGALVRYFSAPESNVQQPTYLISPPPETDASNADTDEGGRPFETIDPLCQKLGLTHNTPCKVGKEKQLVDDVLALDGEVVLIAWEHKHIIDIANLILGSTSLSPQKWPSERFDVVWVFTPDPSGSWVFSQIPELLLAGDSPSVIPMTGAG
jgi:hypothetical protein